MSCTCLIIVDEESDGYALKIKYCRKHAGTDALLDAGRKAISEMCAENIWTQGWISARAQLADAIDACDEPR